MLKHSLLASFIAPLLASAQVLRTDPGVYGPPLEIAHLYYGQWPTGWCHPHFLVLVLTQKNRHYRLVNWPDVLVLPIRTGRQQH